MKWNHQEILNEIIYLRNSINLQFFFILLLIWLIMLSIIKMRVILNSLLFILRIDIYEIISTDNLY